MSEFGKVFYHEGDKAPDVPSGSVTIWKKKTDGKTKLVVATADGKMWSVDLSEESE